MNQSFMNSEGMGEWALSQCESHNEEVIQPGLTSEGYCVHHLTSPPPPPPSPPPPPPPPPPLQRSWVGASKKQCEELLEFIRHLAEDDKEGVMAVKVQVLHLHQHTYIHVHVHVDPALCALL